MSKVKKAAGNDEERYVSIPPDKYMYYRDTLRAATEARRELMEHLQVLIERETVRHQDIWNEIAQLLGYKDIGEVRQHNKCIFIDWINQKIIIKKDKP